jgi:hypothetical protein
VARGGGVVGSSPTHITRISVGVAAALCLCTTSCLLSVFSSSFFSWGRLVPSVVSSLVIGYLLPCFFFRRSYSALVGLPFGRCVLPLPIFVLSSSLFAGLSPPLCLAVAPRFFVSVFSVVPSHLLVLLLLLAFLVSLLPLHSLRRLPRPLPDPLLRPPFLLYFLRRCPTHRPTRTQRPGVCRCLLTRVAACLALSLCWVGAVTACLALGCAAARSALSLLDWLCFWVKNSPPLTRTVVADANGFSERRVEDKMQWPYYIAPPQVGVVDGASMGVDGVGMGVDGVGMGVDGVACGYGCRWYTA